MYYLTKQSLWSHRTVILSEYVPTFVDSFKIAIYNVFIFIFPVFLDALRSRQID